MLIRNNSSLSSWRQNMKLSCLVIPEKIFVKKQKGRATEPHFISGSLISYFEFISGYSKNISMGSYYHHGMTIKACLLKLGATVKTFLNKKRPQKIKYFVCDYIYKISAFSLKKKVFELVYLSSFIIDLWGQLSGWSQNQS